MMGRELTFLPRREAASGRRIAAHYAAPIGIKAPEFRRRVPFARPGQRIPTRERALRRVSKLLEAVSCANSITQAVRHWLRGAAFVGDAAIGHLLAENAGELCRHAISETKQPRPLHFRFGKS